MPGELGARAARQATESRFRRLLAHPQLDLAAQHAGRHHAAEPRGLPASCRPAASRPAVRQRDLATRRARSARRRRPAARSRRRRRRGRRDSLSALGCGRALDAPRPTTTPPTSRPRALDRLRPRGPTIVSCVRDAVAVTPGLSSTSSRSQLRLSASSASRIAPGSAGRSRRTAQVVDAVAQHRQPLDSPMPNAKPVTAPGR